MLIKKQFLTKNSISWLTYQETARCFKNRSQLKFRYGSSQRYLYSSSGVWEDRLSINLMKRIESHWKPRICNEIEAAKSGLAKSSNKNDEHDYYVLSMFPYPSGQLHMGHVRVYSISDAMAHYYRMSGPYRVLHPMGWDAFGLPAENAAIERNLEPQEWTSANIFKMKEQLNNCGFIFDWNKEISTCDPLYYKWTQWIFLKMYEAGLAYQKLAIVNWDPVDKTVLADEQVDSEGRSWRSGAKVEKRNLKQWFLRTTQYSKDLYDGLNDPMLKEWRDIKKIQQNWIGECNGVKYHFELTDKKLSKDDSTLPDTKNNQQLSVWTENPEMVLGLSFIGISHNHVLAEPINDEEIFTVQGYEFYRMNGYEAVNPFSSCKTAVPILVFLPSNSSNTDNVALYAEGCDTFLGIPDISELHHSMMKQIEYNFTSLDVISPTGYFQNCKTEFKGLLAKDEGRMAVLNFARRNKLGGHWTSSKLQDWPISRQRYWGTPIPMVKCNNGCGTVPVKEDSLPIILPDLDTIKDNSINKQNETISKNSNILEGGGSPLLRATDWVETDCPKCGKSGAKRETDTMDTFVDSSWYFLRYLDPRNNHALTKMNNIIDDKEKNTSIRMPVDLYIGGKEHATLHMFFARFVTHFLHSIGMSPVKEPFKNLLVQGMVKGKSYRIKGSGKYIHPTQVNYVEESDKSKKLKAVDISSGKPLVVDWEKMSKSKYNGADPNEVLDKYGMDTTRLLILSDVSPLSDRKWDPEDSYTRISNMLSKILRLVKVAIDSSTTVEKHMCDRESDEKVIKAKAKLWDARNFYVRGANNAYSETRNLSMAMARVQGLLSELSGTSVIPSVGSSAEYHRALANAIILLTPLAPHFCAEMWSGLSDAVKQCQSKTDLEIPQNDEFLWNKSVFHQPWPTLDHNYNLKLKVIRNGKDLTSIPVATWKFNDLTEEDAFNIACCTNEVQDTILPQQESMSYKFEHHKNYEATLSFYVKDPELTPEEKMREKEAKKEEKIAKKLAREARIALRNEQNKSPSVNKG